MMAAPRGDRHMSVPPRDVPVLISKLQPPRLGAQHVPRPRLVDQLRQHADRPLLLLCAAAGSGKTTLLAEWIATDADRPTAWVALDERDNDLMLFLTSLLAALQPLVPAQRFTTRPLLETVHPPPLARLAASLSNDLAHLDRDVRLVLDDYHRLANPQIDALLRDLLRHPPHQLQLVVATRTEPNWPLATWRAYGRAHELQTADLRFTADEATAFIRGELGDAVGDEGVASLYAQSEGWAVGLQLLTLGAPARRRGVAIAAARLGRHRRGARLSVRRGAGAAAGANANAAAGPLHPRALFQRAVRSGRSSGGRSRLGGAVPGGAGAAQSVPRAVCR